MGLPTAEELATRRLAAGERLRRLQEASDAFFSAWEEIEREEKDIAKEVSAYVDTVKLKRIHERIHSSS